MEKPYEYKESKGWTLERDGVETDGEVQFTIESFGSGPSWTSYGGDPGDPPEILVGPIIWPDETQRPLTEDEESKFIEYVCDNLRDYEPNNDFDYDY